MVVIAGEMDLSFGSIIAVIPAVIVALAQDPVLDTLSAKPVETT